MFNACLLCTRLEVISYPKIFATHESTVEEKTMQNLPFEFSHGGYIKEQTGQQRSALRLSTTETIDVETDFDYLFPDIARDSNSLLPADNNQDIIDKRQSTRIESSP